MADEPLAWEQALHEQLDAHPLLKRTLRLHLSGYRNLAYYAMGIAHNGERFDRPKRSEVVRLLGQQDRLLQTRFGMHCLESEDEWKQETKDWSRALEREFPEDANG